MSFGEAVRSVFSNYAKFDGRAPRSEYWWFQLFNLLVVLALYAVLLAGCRGRPGQHLRACRRSPDRSGDLFDCDVHSQLCRHGSPAARQRQVRLVAADRAHPVRRCHRAFHLHAAAQHARHQSIRRAVRNARRHSPCHLPPAIAVRDLGEIHGGRAAGRRERLRACVSAVEARRHGRCTSRLCTRRSRGNGNSRTGRPPTGRRLPPGPGSASTQGGLSPLDGPPPDRA